MKTQEWNDVDKSEWGPGPWQAEPDKVQWIDPPTGLDCLAVRVPEHGAWCGYVGVPPEHPYFKKDYSECPRAERCEEPYCDHTAGHIVEVHGGITFADSCHEGGRICHAPEPGRPEVWWFGFDCAHAWDFRPGDATQARKLGFPDWGESFDKVYRDLGYVKRQVGKMAAQLAAVKP